MYRLLKVIISLRIMFYLHLKTEIQISNFSYRNHTFRSIFTSSFSSFVNFCEAIRFLITQFSIMIWKSETCIYPKVLFMNILEEEIFMQKLQNKAITVYNDQRLKVYLKSETWLLLWQHFKIVTRIITFYQHIRILEAPYNF